MLFNFYTIIKALKHLSDFPSISFKVDSCDSYCSVCDRSNVEGCTDDCLISKVKHIVENLDTVEYRFVADLIVTLSNTHIKDEDSHHELCTFCDEPVGHHHGSCVTLNLCHAIGLYDEDDRIIIEKALYTDNAESLFMAAVKYSHSTKSEISRLKKESKEPNTVANRKELASRTCRHCERVFKDASGRKSHEKTAIKCKENI